MKTWYGIRPQRPHPLARANGGLYCAGMTTRAWLVGFALTLAWSAAADDIAAVDRWTVRTDRQETRDITILVGETRRLQTVWTNLYFPHDFTLANEVVMMYRPYEYEGTNWHYAITGEVVSATMTEIVWRPSHDSGHERYRYRIEIRGDTETLPTARGVLRVIGEFDSSVSAPATPVMREILDFAQTEIRNPGDAPFLRAVDIEELNAANVLYSHALYTNVQDALDALLYTAPSVTLSGGGVYDIGRSITNVDLAWTVNKEMLTRELSGGATVSLGAGGSGDYTVTNALDDSQTTYTLTVGDGTGTAAASTINYFRHRRYWGFSSTASGLDDAEIQALSNELATSRATSKTGLTPTGSQYLWICYPAAWGAATATLLGGWSTTFVLETATFTNAYGYAASYYRYRSPYPVSYPTSLEVQ